MSSVAIITARGGSKRIPHKNIKTFIDRPIIAYSIEAALKSKVFSEVIVSTDDEEIAKIAKQYGASIPFMRSKKNSDDHATTLDVLKEVKEELKKQNRHFDHYCCLYPTAPFITPSILKEAYLLFKESDFNSLIPIVEYEFPIQRAFKVNGKKLSWSKPECSNLRSQDLEKFYHDIGQFYWMKSALLESSESLVTDNTGYIKVDPLIAQDIDNPSDWELAELKYKYKQKLSL